MEEEDCIVLEIDEETKRRRSQCQFDDLGKKEVQFGPLDSMVCKHDMCKYWCEKCEKRAVGSLPIFSGPGNKLKFILQYYCLAHLKAEITKNQESENDVEESYTLLSCSMCQRKDLSICCKCTIVCYIPWQHASNYCPLCR